MKSLDDVFVEEQNVIKLECEVSKEKVKPVWKKDGVVLTSGNSLGRPYVSFSMASRSQMQVYIPVILALMLPSQMSAFRVSTVESEGVLKAHSVWSLCLTPIPPRALIVSTIELYFCNLAH